MSLPLRQRNRSTKTSVRLSAQARGCRSSYGCGRRMPAGLHPHHGYAPLFTRPFGCFGKTRRRYVSLKLVIDEKSTPQTGKKVGYSCIWLGATEGASGAGGAGRRY